MFNNIKFNRSIFSKIPVSSGFTNLNLHLFELSLQFELLIAAISSPSPSTLILHPPAQESITPRDLPPPDTPTDPLTTSPHTPLNPASTAIPKPYHDLTQGEPACSQISYPHLSINIGITRLNLHLSCDITPFSSPDMLSNPCLIRVKWLQETDMENINSQAVNVEDLTYDTEMKFHHGAACAPTEVHLRRGEDVVSVKYTFDGLRRE